MSEGRDARRVLITGAFGILGLATARRFREQGDRVLLIDRAVPSASVLQEFGAPYRVIGEVNLIDASATGHAFGSVLQEGSLDVLVNVAGGFQWQSLADGSLTSWQAMFESNLATTVTATQAALPWLLQSASPRIVNVGAAAAARPASAGMGSYTAAKAGVHKLTESLALELADRGATVNAVLPGIIDTPRNREDMPNADRSRWVSPEAVAEVIAFLASSQASAVNGALIPVTGRG